MRLRLKLYFIYSKKVFLNCYYKYHNCNSCIHIQFIRLQRNFGVLFWAHSKRFICTKFPEKRQIPGEISWYGLQTSQGVKCNEFPRERKAVQSRAEEYRYLICNILSYLLRFLYKLKTVCKIFYNSFFFNFCINIAPYNLCLLLFISVQIIRI